MLENIIALLFILLLSYYILFLLKIYSGLQKLQYQPLESNKLSFVSVIIPFRNEENNILENIKSLQNQNYPKDQFEIIYVNDFSQDKSEKILTDNIVNSNINIIHVPETYSQNAHKKRAIRYGIKKSRGEIIVTTDADCVYESDWLKSLVSNFDDETAFVSGPVEFINSNSLFNQLQRIEFSGLVLAGAGLIGSGKPTICNAANIAYKKSVFDKVNGFSDNLNLSSGDDEMLMQKIAMDTDYKVKFSVDRRSIVKTIPNNSISEFYHQRKRWASKGLFYSDKNLILKLLLIYLFYIGLIAQIILAIFLSPIFWFSALISYLAKSVMEFLIVKKGKQILFPDHLLKYFILVELLHVPYIIIAGLFGSFGNLNWKNRKVRR